MELATKHIFDIINPDTFVPVQQESELLINDSDHTELSIDDFVVAKYIGRSSCGFKHNHKYLVKLVPRNSDDSRTTVIGIRDDSGNDIDIKMHFSSSTSANKFFKV